MFPFEVVPGPRPSRPCAVIRPARVGRVAPEAATQWRTGRPGKFASRGMRAAQGKFVGQAGCGDQARGGLKRSRAKRRPAVPAPGFTLKDKAGGADRHSQGIQGAGHTRRASTFGAGARPGQHSRHRVLGGATRNTAFVDGKTCPSRSREAPRPTSTWLRPSPAPPPASACMTHGDAPTDEPSRPPPMRPPRFCAARKARDDDAPAGMQGAPLQGRRRTCRPRPRGAHPRRPERAARHWPSRPISVVQPPSPPTGQSPQARRRHTPAHR